VARVVYRRGVYRIIVCQPQRMSLIGRPRSKQVKNLEIVKRNSISAKMGFI